LIGKVQLSWWKCNYVVLDVDEEKAIETHSLLIPLGAFILVTLATWSPVCSVAHLIEYPISSFPVLWKVILFSKLLRASLEWKSPM
jgi:hypothetical protein